MCAFVHAHLCGWGCACLCNMPCAHKSYVQGGNLVLSWSCFCPLSQAQVLVKLFLCQLAPQTWQLYRGFLVSIFLSWKAETPLWLLHEFGVQTPTFILIQQRLYPLKHVSSPQAFYIEPSAVFVVCCFMALCHFEWDTMKSQSYFGLCVCFFF